VTRTIAASAATALASGKSKLTRCLRLDLRDDTSLGFTSLDVDIELNLGDSPGTVTYLSGTGILPSDISLSVGLEADNIEVSGPIGAVVSRAAILGGRYDRARAYVFDYDFGSSPSIIRLLFGKVTQARIEAGEFVLEIRSASDAFNQTIGRVFGPMCTHELGDAKCTAVVATYAAEVASVTDDLTFDVTWTDSPAPTVSDLVNGKVEFTSGDLLGTLPIEIWGFSGSTITLYSPTAELPQVGDTLTVSDGCDKTRATCRDRFANMLNFGGWPDSPGTANVVKYAIPGSSA